MQTDFKVLAADIAVTRAAVVKLQEASAAHYRAFEQRAGLAGIHVGARFVTSPDEIDNLVRLAETVCHDPEGAKDIRARFTAAVRAHGDAWLAAGGSAIAQEFEVAEAKAESAWNAFMNAPATDLSSMAAKLRALSAIFRDEDADAEFFGTWSVPGPVLEDAIAGCFGSHRQVAA